MITTEIIQDYIKWSNNKPFVQRRNYNSLWGKPTAEQFFKYLTSDKERLKIAKEIVSWDNKKQLDFADELWNTIARVPYVWVPDRADLRSIDDYEQFCKENPNCDDDLYFILSRSMRSCFKQYFWNSVILPLADLFDKGGISFVSADEYANLEIKYKNLEIKYKEKYLECCKSRTSNIELTGKVEDLKAKISRYGLSRMICYVFGPWIIGLLCIITWGITYASCGTKNVKAEEQQQQFDITVNNPQNKDINLDIKHE